MTNPRIDILLPFWGDVELLKKAIESVLSQSRGDWRLLIFDDHYPSDEPAKYIASLKDNRIFYSRNENNLGITNNFNHALEAAEADYCVMFGCDDIMLPNYIETALKNIGNADFYQPRVDVINEHGKICLPLGDRIKKILQPKKSCVLSGEELATSLSHGNWLYFPSITWKTATIKKYGFDAKYKIVEDVVLEFEVIKNEGTLFFDTNTTFQYRRFSESLSSKEKARGGIRFSEEDEVYDMYAGIFKAIGWKKAARAAKLRVMSRLHKIIT